MILQLQHNVSRAAHTHARTHTQTSHNPPIFSTPDAQMLLPLSFYFTVPLVSVSPARHRRATPHHTATHRIGVMAAAASGSVLTPRLINGWRNRSRQKDVAPPPHGECRTKGAARWQNRRDLRSQCFMWSEC